MSCWFAIDQRIQNQISLRASCMQIKCFVAENLERKLSKRWLKQTSGNETCFNQNKSKQFLIQAALFLCTICRLKVFRLIDHMNFFENNLRSHN